MYEVHLCWMGIFFEAVCLLHLTAGMRRAEQEGMC